MKQTRLVIAILLVMAGIFVSYALPKRKYKSLDILSKVQMPVRVSGWQSRDASQQFNPNDLRYNFIQRMLARVYWNKYGENVIFMILDAGNFHNPKVCYGSAGYAFKDLPQLEFEVKGRRFKAVTVLFNKDKEQILVVYWLVINKKVVDWTKQKLIELWYSLTGKRKAGLMVRLEIPVISGRVEEELKLAKEFIADIAERFSDEELEYVFGS